MGNINTVALVGGLTRDGEIRYTGAGTAVMKFSLAVGERIKKGDQWEDYTNYFDCVLWGKQAESLQKYLVKGKQVAISARAKQNRWEQDGQKRSKVEFIVETIQLLGGKTDGLQSTKQASSSSSGFEDDIPF